MLKTRASFLGCHVFNALSLTLNRDVALWGHLRLSLAQPDLLTDPLHTIPAHSYD